MALQELLILASASEAPHPQVFVDPLMNHGWRLGASCHLHVLPDTPEDILHHFAARLGLRPRWYQNLGVMPHYDLTESKRKWAVRNGAVEIDRQTLVAHIRAWREMKGKRR